MQPYGLTRPGLVRPPADTVTSVAVTTSGQTIDVPTGASFVEYTGTNPAIISFGSTGATYPATTSTAGSSNGAYLNSGEARFIGSTASCTAITLLSSAAGAGTLQWWGPGG